VGIHLAGKHALELELLDLEPKAVDVRLDSLDRAGVALGVREIEQFRGVGQASRQSVQAADHLLELGAFLAEILRALGSIPNPGLF
jgi:hypothetical protein